MPHNNSTEVACYRPSVLLQQGRVAGPLPGLEGVMEKAMIAAANGDAHAVAAWLDEGGGVDARCAERKDGTLLMEAAAGGQEAIVRMLLQRGASVNLQGFIGVTALMVAAANGHATIVQALLDAKADASLQNTHGTTALMVAEHCKHTAAAQVLRQHAKRQAVEAAHIALNQIPNPNP